MFFRLFSTRLLLCAAFCFAAFLPVSRGLADDAKKNATPADVFEGMRKSFNAEKAKGVHARYLWKISGPDGGDFWIVVDDGKFDMGKGPLDKPDVTFTVTDKDWVAISNDELGGTRAYLTRRLVIDGPMSTARLLDGMFP